MPALARTLRFQWLIAIGYAPVFLLLDWVSFIRPFHGLNITPWNPQPALAVALLLWNRSLFWLVWASILLAELVVRGVPSDWLVMMFAAAALAFCYAAIARGVRQHLEQRETLSTRRELLWLAGLVVMGALLSAAAYVMTIAAGGIGFGGSVFEAITRYWIGDAVGMMVMLPTLLMLMDGRRRADMVIALRSFDIWLVFGLAALLLVIVFGQQDHDQFKFFYLLFVPVVWASARFGLPGAVLSAAVTQVGLIVAVQSIANPDLTVFELQILMAAITMTGLMLGVTVDERQRATSALKGSLHLAAAGQMAAALAHELSQPLTALSTYAQASHMVATSSDMPEAERRVRLADIANRMIADALRAGDVVKRLRDFFRSGSTQLQSIAVESVLREAIASHRRRAEALGASVELDVRGELPTVLMDPVQFGVVLRNLLANALDAVAQLGAAGRVVLGATVRKEALLVEVRDNGPGIDEVRLASLFEPGPSEKPGGMGIGLSISRAIVEVHGGLLWAEPGPHGRFCFTLPIDAPAPHRSHAP